MIIVVLIKETGEFNEDGVGETVCLDGKNQRGIKGSFYFTIGISPNCMPQPVECRCELRTDRF